MVICKKVNVVKSKNDQQKPKNKFIYAFSGLHTAFNIIVSTDKNQIQWFTYT